MDNNVKTILNQMIESGFDDARVTIIETEANELNLAHNHVSLMRTTQSVELSLMGIKDAKRAMAKVTSLDTESVSSLIQSMLADAEASPADDAYAVSENQQGSFVKGPQSVDRDAIAESAKKLLEYRSQTYPTFQIEEAAIKHTLIKTSLVTSRDTNLESVVGSYGVVVMGSSKDEHGSSSFNYTGGNLDTLPDQLSDVLDIDTLMANSVQETQATPVGDKFTGDVILTPVAVMDLVSWLMQQTGDFGLLSGTSVFKDSVGEAIASSLLTLRNGAEGAGEAPFNSEGFVIEPVTLVEQGKLNHLLPSYYGSRKLDLPHLAAGQAWRMDAGDVTREDMLASVSRGALVNRLSMGSPAANGDFSGVIKNSFFVENGQRTRALSETMITGNVAQMLKDIQAVSKELTDFGGDRLPWLKISGLRFS